jgi:hypothetical protein
LETSSDGGAGRQALFSSPRMFRLWRYGVGHSQLLLRSLATAGEPCLDVLFEDVSWIEMPTNFDSLTLVASRRLAGHPANGPVSTRARLTVELRTPEGSGLVECYRVSVFTSSYDPGTGNEPIVLDTVLVESAEDRP